MPRRPRRAALVVEAMSACPVTVIRVFGLHAVLKETLAIWRCRVRAHGHLTADGRATTAWNVDVECADTAEKVWVPSECHPREQTAEPDRVRPEVLHQVRGNVVGTKEAVASRGQRCPSSRRERVENVLLLDRHTQQTSELRVVHVHVRRQGDRCRKGDLPKRTARRFGAGS